jgi:hypothetical protein
MSAANLDCRMLSFLLASTIGCPLLAVLCRSR